VRPGAARPEGVPVRRVLLTGFEPFGGETVNPSADAVRSAARTGVTDPAGAAVSIRAAVLPVELARALPVLFELLDEVRPELVVCFGQAGGRCGVTPERVAVNVEEAVEPDNAGAVLSGGPVVAGGPPAYLSTLPVAACVEALHRAAIPASVSTTAGLYLCNHVFYGLMHAVAQSSAAQSSAAPTPATPTPAAPTPATRAAGLALDGARGVLRAGFVHVPYAHHQVLGRPDTPSLAQHTIDEAVRVVVAACVADLDGADLDGADLDGADLDGAARHS